MPLDHENPRPDESPSCQPTARKEPSPSRQTLGLRTGLDRDPAMQSVVPPIHMSTNYAFRGLDGRGEFDYSRSGNPTRALLSEALATLEGGAGAVATASGMAAVTLCVNAFVPAGGRVVAPHDCYGGTWRQLNWLAEKGVLRVDFVDLTSQESAAAALAEPAALVLVETPSNPLLRLTDIEAVAAMAHAAGAVVAVDNTFCSPILQQPLELGADVVLHSTTKFINGHSDVVGGAVVAKNQEQVELLAGWANCLGLTAGAFDAYLTLRGLRTLDARVRVHEENTRAILQLLDSHPAVGAVNHPSLPQHPGHDLARRQQPGGFGSLLSFELVGGLPAVRRFAEGLQIALLAESLGGIESLVCHPATMTHASMPAEIQQAAGITDSLVRMSVGIEGGQDLVADIRAGLDRALISGD
ncbi:cystathionine gamma-synthase [Luteococcus sp. Sow4_B9]|uniref:cystathionine gamma-synthase n=1 Tax=Luteococcus sp. Sow4_B9 TaxID=3438792 RepID=UPI003F948D45